MTGKIKIITLALVTLVSFVGYTFLFVTILGVDKADAISVLTTGTVDVPVEAEASDSTAAADSSNTAATLADSLNNQMAIINAARADLEKLKNEISSQIAEKSQQDEQKLNNLAKIYDSMDPSQLTTIMAGLDDTLVVDILPRMKSKNVSKILESMPPERAAHISTMLLGRN